MTAEAANRFELKESVLEKINQVFAAHPNVQRAVLYGSRAKGTHHPGSDIDLALFGKSLTASELLKIDLELDDLLLPYKIDLSLHHQIDSKELLEHIARVGKVLYRESKPCA
ncbi:MAG: nucleotidyltransferase domain-containing protein [Deferrisomatales bacterium]|nr:nucleotidyltransferase domain-containing protein [Deferrisomatales bacterium]